MTTAIKERSIIFDASRIGEVVGVMGKCIFPCDRCGGEAHALVYVEVTDGRLGRGDRPEGEILCSSCHLADRVADKERRRAKAVRRSHKLKLTGTQPERGD